MWSYTFSSLACYAIQACFPIQGFWQGLAYSSSKVFDKVWYTDLLHKLKLYEILGQMFGLISYFLSNRWLWVVQNGKFSQEYPVNAGVPKAAFLVLYNNDLPDDIICNTAIDVDDITIYCKCDQASDLWEHLEMAAELDSDLQDFVDWDRKWSVDFNAGKAQLILFG